MEATHILIKDTFRPVVYPTTSNGGGARFVVVTQNLPFGVFLCTAEEAEDSESYEMEVLEILGTPIQTANLWGKLYKRPDPQFPEFFSESKKDLGMSNKQRFAYLETFKASREFYNTWYDSQCVLPEYGETLRWVQENFWTLLSDKESITFECLSFSTTWKEDEAIISVDCDEKHPLSWTVRIAQDEVRIPLISKNKNFQPPKIEEERHLPYRETMWDDHFSD